MADEGFKRKLAAILSADVEGYSRLMDDDEEATVRTLTAYRTAITDLVQQFRGRIVDTPGDNILAEFISVVDSVNCAVEIQRELAERNAELPDNRRMEFRIGVNLGDEDRVTLDQIQSRLNSNDDVIKVMKGNNTEDVKREHFNKVFKDTVIDYHGDRIDFYKNVMNPNVFPMLVEFMYREMSRDLVK